jgi:CHAD domain-containing protein
MAERDQQLKRAAAAAGIASVTGAAIVAGRAGIEALRDSDLDGYGDGDGPSRAYRLEEGEPLGEGLLRIARGRADDALDQLRAADGDPASSVHETRKDMKKLRSVLRIARGGLGEKLYRRENDRFRAAAQALAGARDAHVMLETLDDLEERSSGELGVAELREQLEAERKRETADAERKVGDAIAAIEAGRDAISEWPLEGDDWSIVEVGLRRAYGRGRNRFREAAAEPSAEALHEWRKRVKDLWYGLRILAPSWPDVAKPLADEAHELSDLLGDDHDLAVLAAAARERPDAFAGASGREALLDAIAERRSALQRDARSLGARLYADSPKAFVGRLERWWRAWRADAGVVAAA